jgi:hypothetical protein
VSGDKIKQRTATAVSVAAVAVYAALENKLRIGICGDIFNYGSPAGEPARRIAVVIGCTGDNSQAESVLHNTDEIIGFPVMLTRQRVVE